MKANIYYEDKLGFSALLFRMYDKQNYYALEVFAPENG